MLTVWLIRAFTVDMVEHMAQVKGGVHAVRLAPEIRRSLGVGNSTGLGMAPFVVRHPTLLNNWTIAREEALARVRAQASATRDTIDALHRALDDATLNARLWRSDHPVQVPKLADLRRDLDHIAAALPGWDWDAPQPWDALWLWGEASLSLEGQEALLALMLEPHGALIDDLAETMCADEETSFRLNGAMSVADLRAILQQYYDWALAIDFDLPESTARFWYVSEEKLEPRLGERQREDGGELEQPLCIARLAASLAKTLDGRAADEPVATLLLAHPEHRYMVRRAQTGDQPPLCRNSGQPDWG